MSGRLKHHLDVGLRTYESVARNGSYGAAAEELGISVPAISRRISNLESSIGYPVWEPNRLGNRRYTPSRKGAVLLQVLQENFARLEAVLEALRQAPEAGVEPGIVSKAERSRAPIR